ncbi:hypothetical protein [Phenylobacterium sp.]|uniref:hypothetical protein n=1 Tax=Phenylobacterium sp. TaxID=1871053 RepID=UPI00120108EA|nr:hypothetical protein [Phenylobacterium sp.]THD64066.1 MAG: hypothetical protein E8A49_03460 [Phenylobacterium sp.]
MQVSESYNHQTVVLDGETFSDCAFAACRLVYSGGEPPQFESCRFDDCEWKFEEAAAHSLAFLKLMWTVGAKPAVQSIIKEITVVGR